MPHPDTTLNALHTRLQPLKRAALCKRQLTLSDIHPLLRDLGAQPIGESYEGRPIERISMGHGPLIILAWTQMHGDESTATAAVLDWLQLLREAAAGEQALAIGLPSNWQELVTLQVIPMLNPDGAERGTRENAQGIDINRDALAQQSPEGRLLWQQVQSLRPSVAFNLHDQNPYYTVGASSEPATIAFLAPAYHPDKHVDSARLQAKQLIAHMRKVLAHWLPNGIARYNDSYSARSFGDQIAGTGASTILIESGAHRDDPERQVARELNVIALHAALQALLNEQAREYTLADYYAIPENRSDGLCDIKIYQLTFAPQGQQAFQADVCIVRNGADYIIDFVGDASSTAGFVELAGHGKKYPATVHKGECARALLAFLNH
ncbi:M14 family zinc carboxypeptidase [Pseudidiomarina atlantica]|jgi:hypothetical protein|uniref:M14 family zinc carboxypeptidase n=1 Tax=Pseudidiomarina atlantica TaxID=1517416 RepID=UPI0009DF4AC0|nr:M14 family zinc carboxypeptidase [Pseudidiomarina atlantica]